MKRIVAFFMLCFLVSGAFADEKVGAWTIIVSPEEDYQVAKTLNGSGGVAGVLCFMSSKSCNAYFASDVKCNEGEKYPVMMSAISGSMNTQATCIRYGRVNLLVLENMADVIDAFEDGGEVAFVVPMKGNKFIASRFDCVGAKSAIRKVKILPDVAPKLKDKLAQLSAPEQK